MLCKLSTLRKFRYFFSFKLGSFKKVIMLFIRLEIVFKKHYTKFLGYKLLIL